MIQPAVGSARATVFFRQERLDPAFDRGRERPGAKGRGMLPRATADDDFEGVAAGVFGGFFSVVGLSEREPQVFLVMDDGQAGADGRAATH